MENENLTPVEEEQDILTAPEQEESVTEEENTPKEPIEEEGTEAEEVPSQPENTSESPAEETEGGDNSTDSTTDEDGEADEEAEESPAPAHSSKSRRRLRFFIVVLGLALCILILLCCAMSPLKSLLAQYESAQPHHMEEEVYNMLFADPDWDLLYDLAGVESTAFEGKDAFIRYMQNKTEGQELTCVQTSAGLSGDRRYLLYLDDELLASFTLTETADSTLYAQWTLADVDVYFRRSESVTIVTAPGHTVYINGIPLDDSYITTTTQTVAENYLPEGVHGYRSQELQIGDLLCMPEIVVLDRNFNQLPLFYSAATGVYSTEIPVSDPITEEESTIVLEAAQTQALFAVRGCNISQLRQHFNSNSQIYTDLSEAEPFCESYQSHEFHEDSVSITDFYRYSDTLFSARVSLSMDVTDTKNATTTYQLDTTYIFTRNNSGVYLVTSSLEEDLTEKTTQVRLTYLAEETVLLSEMVDVDATVFSAPEAIRSDGASPLGWGKQEPDGSVTTVLTAGDDGSFLLAEGQTLSAMTLYPIYSETEAAE